MARINFDASNVAPQQAFEALPSGWYKLAITDSSLEPTSDGKGTFLKLEISVLEGRFKNRKLFENLNLENVNPQTVEIAQQALSAICHATGVIRCEDSSQLHNIPIFGKLSIEAERTEDSLKNTINPATKTPYKPGDPGTKTYEAKNRLRGYKNINDVPSGYSADGAAPVAGSVATGGPAPAWANKKPATPTDKPAEAPKGPATTSSATPPWEKKGAAAEPAKEDAKPKGPKGPKGKAESKVAPAEPKFYVYFADDNMPVKSLSEIKADLDAGMPADTQVLPEAEIKADEPKWVDASTLFEKAAEPAKQETAAPAADVPPWQRKK